MPDNITAKGSDAKFHPHPEGQFVGQCVDTIDMGHRVETYVGTPDKLSQKCVLVFRTGERNADTGEYIDPSREFTVSMGDLANLRKFLEQWRGKPYTPEQIEEGVPLHKLTGNHALLTIAHKKSGKGRVYANITACVGIPKQMASAVTAYTDYTRAEFWETRKKEYADGATKFRNESAAANQNPDFSDFPDDEAEDSLPF